MYTQSVTWNMSSEACKLAHIYITEALSNPDTAVGTLPFSLL